MSNGKCGEEGMAGNNVVSHEGAGGPQAYVRVPSSGEGRPRATCTCSGAMEYESNLRQTEIKSVREAGTTEVSNVCVVKEMESWEQALLTQISGENALNIDAVNLSFLSTSSNAIHKENVEKRDNKSNKESNSLVQIETSGLVKSIRSEQLEVNIEHRLGTEVRKHTSNTNIGKLINNKKLNNICYKKYMYNDKLHANLNCENREYYVSCTASYDSRDSKANKKCEVCDSCQNDGLVRMGTLRSAETKSEQCDELEHRANVRNLDSVNKGSSQLNASEVIKDVEASIESSLNACLPAPKQKEMTVICNELNVNHSTESSGYSNDMSSSDKKNRIKNKNRNPSFCCSSRNCKFGMGWFSKIRLNTIRQLRDESLAIQ